MEHEKVKERRIVDKAFAQRLDDVCNDNPLIPPKNHGRLGYIAKEMEKITGEKISAESVRKWFFGEARPRPVKMKVLAQIIGTAEEWLSLGKRPELKPEARKLRDRALGGAADLIQALVQLDGGNFSIPQPNDPRSEYVDVYAIIKGALYPFHASLDLGAPKGHRFAVPNKYEDCATIGIVRTGGANFDLFEISHEACQSHGVRKGAHIEVVVEKTASGYFAISSKGKTPLTGISSFTNRL